MTRKDMKKNTYGVFNMQFLKTKALFSQSNEKRALDENEI